MAIVTVGILKKVMEIFEDDAEVIVYCGEGPDVDRVFSISDNNGCLQLNTKPSKED